MTYGFSKNAHVRLSALEYRVEEGMPQGISFKIEYSGNMVPLRIDGVLSKTHAYATGAGAAVGLIFGLNLVTISENLKKYRPAEGRMSFFPGVEGSIIIDDSYNASPVSMEAAIASLSAIPGKRKVAILGDMLEVEPYTIEVHEKAGYMVSEAADVLVTVGTRAKFIAEAARASGFSKKDIFAFGTADEAARMMPSLVRKGDVILVKGAHAVHMEKIVEELKNLEVRM
jgi:UDP-N-acetylmuramoyl-tripeptide--D-alanyl-D-alanine ligase